MARSEPQINRVLHQLEQRADVNQVDFLAPNVIDGGTPIIRLAARIKDLRDLGHNIVDAGERQSCKAYRLVRRAPEKRPDWWPGPDQNSNTLFDER